MDGIKRNRAFAHETILDAGMVGEIRALHHHESGDVLILRYPGFEYDTKEKSASFQMLKPAPLRFWQRELLQRRWKKKEDDITI